MWYNPVMDGTVLGNVISILYLGAFMAAGQLVARRVFPRDCAAVRATLGAALGLVMLMWLPALFSFAWGFSPPAQYAALAAAAAVGAAAKYKAPPLLPPERRTALKPYLSCVLPATALLCALTFSHTIPVEKGALFSGQSTFGDMCMHLGIISSITRQGFFPPEYSILARQPMCYPFLCDSVSSTFYTLGASLRLSYMLPMFAAFFAVASGVYLFFEDWLRRADKAVLAYVLFFLGGGFGFAYFLNNAAADPGNFTRIFTGFYETPTNLAAENIRWVNVIADMLIPQRATLFGWSILFPCLFLLRRAAFDGEKGGFAPLGVMAGALPLVHTHSFLALGLVSVPWFLRAIAKKRRVREFALYGFIAAALALPQLVLFTFRQAGGFLTFNFNWVNDSDPFLWFYIKNLGLIFILLLPAYLAADRRSRDVWLGVLPLWILSELIQFQPNPYDNNKLLFVWFAFSCGITASMLIDVWQRLAGMKGRGLLCGMAVLAMTLSGLLTLGRELVGRYEVFPAAEAEAARFIDADTPADAVFLTGTNHNNAVAALSGRSIVCGSASYLYYHGYDTSQREADVRAMYENPAENAGLYEKYGVSYIYIGSAEMGAYALSHSDFAGFELVFANGGAAVYKYK